MIDRPGPVTLACLATGGIGLVYLLLVAAAGLTARPVRSDVAVVLGNAVTPAGRPSPRLRARLDRAVALFRAGLAPRILVSGGIEPSGADEAAVMAAYLVERGVPAAAIVQDPHGDDSWATARHTAALLRRGGGREGEGEGGTAIVVTQWFHVPRTMLAMRRFGVRGVSGAWPRFVEWRDAYSFLREAVALPFYAVRRVDAGAAAGRPPPP